MSARIGSEQLNIWLGFLLASGIALCSPRIEGQTSRMPVPATSAPGGLQQPYGTVAGSIFWDEARVAYTPSVPCQGLQVELDVITATGLQKVGTSTQFQFTQSQRPGHGLGLCGYSFSRVREGVALQVQVSVSGPFGSRLAATGPFGATGGQIRIPGGQCNNAPSSPTDLQSGWVGCGERVSNVNFELLPRNAVATLPRGSTMLLQQSPETNTPASKPMLLQPNPQPGGPAQSNGILVPAVKPATEAQPSSPTAREVTGGVRRSGIPQPGTQPVAGGGSNLNAGNSGAPPALIGLLRKQGSLKVVSGQRTHYAIAPMPVRIAPLRKQPGGGQIALGQTMDAPVPKVGSRLATSPAIARNLKFAYVPSHLLSPKENTECEQQEAQGAAPTIYRVDGKTTGPSYSPDPKTNPHTIVGCGFGNGTGTMLLRLLQQEFQQSWWGNGTDVYTATIYTVNFDTQSWNDHEIVASIDPNTSGLPDWFYVTLEVKTKLSGYAPGGQFTALRQPLLLTSIPQKESSLYQSGSPYFLSPVSNYYGLKGTVAVMRQGLSGPVAGQDQFTLHLAPGFAIDSTQTDLLVSDTSANVTSKPAIVNGNTITVTYPVESMPSGNSTVYYSIYGLSIWVIGPAGMNPVAQ